MAAALLAGCTDAPAPTGPFSQLVVFGDSLSDTGNVFFESGFLIPAPPYDRGRLSNGDIWIDLLARHYALSADPSYVGGTNYAQGGASTGLGLSDFSGSPIGPSIRQQVEFYRATPRGDELFVVWGGGNDAFSVLEDGCGATPADIAANVALAVEALYDRGGRWFLVPNVPDVGLTPRFVGDEIAPVATSFCHDINTVLDARLDELETRPDIHICRIDVETLFADLVANPPPGVTNVTESAVRGLFGGGLKPGVDPDTHLFWDSIHPTRITHARLAEVAIAQLESQPLPTDVAPAQATPEQIRLPAPLEFWLRYLALLGQPSADPAQCGY